MSNQKCKTCQKDVENPADLVNEECQACRNINSGQPAYQVQDQGKSKGGLAGGIFDIILGLVFIVGGASGGLVLRGTESSGALAVIGVVLLIWGIYKCTRS